MKNMLLTKLNTVIVIFCGGGSSIVYGTLYDMLEIDWTAWSIQLAMKVLSVSIIGAFGTLSGLMIKYLFEKIVKKK